MFNPNEFFAILTAQGEAQVEVKVTDNWNTTIWGCIPDSFTADDLSAIAQMFEAAARELRES